MENNSALLDSLLVRDAVMDMHGEKYLHDEVLQSINLEDQLLVVKAIAKSKGDLFFVKASGLYDCGIGAGRIGRKFVNTFKNIARGDKLTYGRYVFNPYIEVLISAVVKFDLRSYGFSLRSLDEELVPLSHAEFLVAILNDAVRYIRDEIGLPQFARKINSHCRSANKNTKTLYNFVDGLFDRHSRLLVLRVDLGYAESFCRGDRAVNRTDIRLHREKLWSVARANPIFKYLVGYVWKLEWKPLKGYHFHMAFFLDARHVQQDITYCRLIGELWSRVVTGYKGGYWNCNRDKDSYPERVLGVVHRGDIYRRGKLKKALSYLTKADIISKLKGNVKEKNFGKSEIKKLNSMRKRGGYASVRSEK
ncbi:hypothetical protein C1893_10755 [Pseudomonas sp. MPR-ANC1]|uniref:YagK/YfjJ domain-containing protein n=1 Tax=Pseudomonas sp. MPR-ANC1 TaxID=2075548 RepID=UPI000CD0D6EE|nr:inovirus-type Gp2 protein [Pseudomonas sp. MPR-ANC1]POA48329.1 hypothetical protein C1893_10755 [Pseudomonas sp. MPR-ANC1]